MLQSCGHKHSRWGGALPLVGYALFIALAFVGTARAADLPEYQRAIRSVKDVTYQTVQSLELKADVYRPDDDLVRPTVLLVHGGAWSSGDKWNFSDHGRELALAGYVAVSINYRLAPKWKFPAQIDDCRAALRWLIASADTYHVDTEQIAVYGYSAGGHLAALLATDPPPNTGTIRVCVAGGAPCDFSFIGEKDRTIAHVMGGTRAEVPLIYKDASPTTYASKETCPIFFYHGTTDLIVPMSSSRTLCDQLEKLGVETEYYELPNYGHLFTFIHPQPRREAIEFLNKHMKMPN